MDGKAAILIIDDELSIRRFLKLTLEAHDYTVIEADTGKDGLYKAATEHPAGIILDLGLPDMTGMQVLAQIREWSKVPVLILSVQDGEQEKVLALESGADDYITKPFSVKEVIARVRVALRHFQQPDNARHEFCNKNLYVNIADRIVKNNDIPVKLTATEYLLMIQFITNPGKVLTHRQLMKEVWGPYRDNETSNLRVHMAQLRKKLESDPASPQLFITESGVGYRMPADDESDDMC